MFWGFILEPKKRYNTTVTKGFHISMAALDPKSVHDNDISSVVLNVDGTETILCNLGKPNYLQERLDLNFIEGNTITLEVKGKACVHLSGYFIMYDEGQVPEDMSDYDDEDLEDEDEEDEDIDDLVELKKLTKKSKNNKTNVSTTEEEDSDDDDEDDDEDDDDEDEEDDESMDVSDLTFDEDDDTVEETAEKDDSEEEQLVLGSPGSTPMPNQKKPKVSLNSTPVSGKKKQQQQQNDKNGSNKKNKGQSPTQSPQQQKQLTNGTTTPGSNKKKKNKDGANATPNNKQQNENKNTPKKSLEGGVIIEEIKVGQGVPAKYGKMVSVYYSGKLKTNNKQFDSTTQGPGFKFRLGKGEVIKGWDVGLNGMKVGGKRRITIPAHMAYGNKGSPPAIPPNSTLVFDVELKHVQ